MKFMPFPLCNVNNETGEILYFNQKFIEKFGFTKADIPSLEDWWQKAYPDPKYRKWVLNNWKEAVEKAAESKSEIRSDIYDVTCRNGDLKNIIIGGVTFQNEFLATFIDVTEQKRIESEKEKLMLLSILSTDFLMKLKK